jgi:hypothetical protein
MEKYSIKLITKEQKYVSMRYNRMNKKIMAISILAIFMLLAISYATAVSTTNTEKKESPLYGLRTRRATTEKISNIIENIKTNFLGNRIFLLPIQWLKNKLSEEVLWPTLGESCGRELFCELTIKYCYTKSQYNTCDKWCLSSFPIGC